MFTKTSDFTNRDGKFQKRINFNQCSSTVDMCTKNEARENKDTSEEVTQTIFLIIFHCNSGVKDRFPSELLITCRNMIALNAVDKHFL